MSDVDVRRAEAREYSKDYWDLVFDQLAKRRLFKLALTVLALLYGLAIYAPFLGNDRILVSDFDGGLFIVSLTLP